MSDITLHKQAATRRGLGQGARMAILLASAVGGLILASVGGLVLPAMAQIAVRNQGYVPYSEEPINYRSENLTDPIAKLQKQIDKGEVKLDYEAGHGYLRSVLAKLNVPISSQTLVFSKTSFQYKKISPETPRALYFNDDVYVGQVHDGKVLEFVSFDPAQGAIFYILDEQKNAKPVFERAELDCTTCHVAAGTRNVPGVLLRSIYTTSTGAQETKTEAFITGHQSPLKERFGGWYVTGTHGEPTHMGNVFVPPGTYDKEDPVQLDRAAGANLTKLDTRVDASAYLTPHSDIVAHLVQAHQTQMHNLITLTNYQTRLAVYAAAKRSEGGSSTGLSEAEKKQFQSPAEELVRYLLFANEAQLDAPVKGTSGYTEEFTALGPRDSKGRSLRDFDLRTRIFKYPCSYLIYSEAFDALPEQAKQYVYHRLLEVLSGREQGPEFARLSGEDRRAILEILLATKPGLPEEWNQYRQSANGEVKAASR